MIREPTVYEGIKDTDIVDDIHESSNDDPTAPVHRRASTRIDGSAGLGLRDQVSIALFAAHSRWIERADRAELRRALLGLIMELDT